ncbi:MAG: DinB family protein [Sphingobacteriaceae bacterium]
MSINRIAVRIQESTARYEAFLDNLSETDFQQNPKAGGWSYAEVYSHIFEANLISLLALEKCVKGTAEENTKSMHPAVWLILFFGKFPPGKIKAPARIAAMVKQISPAEARKLMQAFNQRLLELVPKVSEASSTQKAKHPRLGLLTARQWLRFIEIHTKHHEKQLHRIAKVLAQ